MLHRKQRVVNTRVVPTAHRLLEVVEYLQWDTSAQVGRRSDADSSQIVGDVPSNVGKVFESGNLCWNVRFHGTGALQPNAAPKWQAKSLGGEAES